MKRKSLRAGTLGGILISAMFGLLLVNFSSAQTASSSPSVTSSSQSTPSSDVQLKTGGVATSTPINLSSETFTGRSTYNCLGDVQVSSCVATSGLVTYESGNVLGKTLKFDSYNGANADTSFGASVCGGTCKNADTGQSVTMPNCASLPTGTLCGTWK